MRTVCNINQCTGCALCISKCRKNAIHIEDSLKAYNAVIDEQLCVNCGQCEKACPANHPLPLAAPISWQQGWASDEDVRMAASSGGLATALSIGFVNHGGVVCSCVFCKGKFLFDIATKEDEVHQFRGSKYVKSNPVGIYEKVKRYLDVGIKVLFIGLPCQSAAIKQYTKNHNLLYTVDLICHGTPSPESLKMYLTDKRRNIEELVDIKFRQKANYKLSDGFNSFEPSSVLDFYTFAFLESVCYTENCYSCRYAAINRVSDITLGDSWGSKLPKEEQDKGISLVLCQNEKGQELLDMASLHLEAVDVDIAIGNNHQLTTPSKKPAEYERFCGILAKKKSFNQAMAGCYPMVYIRQRVKYALIKIGILRRK